jgi:hypothetical protein
MSLTSDFCGDPIEFATRFAISVTGDPTRLIARWRGSHSGEQRDLLQVEKDSRIVFLKVGEPDRLMGPKGAKLFTLSDTRPDAEAVPVFWLPYRQNGIAKIALKDRRQEDDVGKDGEALFFFTTGLDGCSVFVEGSAEHPTVYHVNAAEARHPDNVDRASNDERVIHDDRLHRQFEVERRWTTFTKAPSLLSKPGKSDGETIHQTSVLHPNQYVPNYFGNRREVSNAADSMYWYLAKQLLSPGYSIDGCDIKHRALFFGFRKGGDQPWEFWVQQRASVSFQLSKATERGTDRDFKTETMLVTDGSPPVKAWPGGAGMTINRMNSTVFARI